MYTDGTQERPHKRSLAPIPQGQPFQLPPTTSTATDTFMRSASPPSPQRSDDEWTPDVEPYTTKINEFGIHRIYPYGLPSYIPDSTPPSNTHTILQPSGYTVCEDQDDHINRNQPFVPTDISQIDYSTAPINQSVHMLVDWHHASHTKTAADTDHLVNNILRSPHFSLSELDGFRGISRKSEVFDKMAEEKFLPNEGWTQSSVEIPVPSTQVSTTEAEAVKYKVDGVFHRDILGVVKGALEEPGAERFHLYPYKEYWQATPDSEPVRIYDELYSADAFLDEYGSVLQSARMAGSTMDVVLLGLMLWSDSTHLASFGTASLWPVYMYIGNLSKYIRSKPSALAAHHVAYIPKVSLRLKSNK